MFMPPISESPCRLDGMKKTDVLAHRFRAFGGDKFQPLLSKKLSQYVKMEKNTMRSMELVSRERQQAAVSIPRLPVLRLVNRSATTVHLG